LKIAAVVLAAGASTRLGERKQDLRLGTETLLERTVRIARQAGLAPVIAVVAHGRPLPDGTGARLVVNEDAAEGMASSIRAGVAAAIAEDAGGVVVLACDQPFVTVDHLRRLAQGGGKVVASAYAGRKGVPAYFPAKAFQDLLDLRGDTGARDLLREARAIPLKNGELDIDTAEDLKRARELYAVDPPL
jgi:CTP:molybdopterin cytidylyltransferase MocA